MSCALKKGFAYLAFLILLLPAAACAAESGDETPPPGTATVQPAVAATVAPTARAEGVVSTPEDAGSEVETPAVAPLPTSAAAPLPTPTPITYTVQAGDHLGKIADQFDIDVADLTSLNGITDPNLIMPGLVLTIPNPTPIPGATADAGEPPTTYRVQPGDTLAGIAALYGVPVEQLATFNGLDLNAVLLPDRMITIPLGGHVVTEGDTLVGIADRYAVSMDALIALNADKYPSLPTQPGVIRTTWFLKLPQETVAEGYNCDPLPEPRRRVITHTVAFGMQLACLSSKFGVSVNTLVWANQEVLLDGGLQDGDVILVPPADGALYTTSENDVASETTLEALMTWYGVSDPAAIQDWEGSVFSDSLAVAGQQLFIRDADLLDGSYEPPRVVVAASPLFDEEGAIVIPPGESTGSLLGGGYVVPTGAPPAGALQPKTIPWLGTTILDTGLCNVVEGSGWSTPLIWPTAAREVNPGRNFDDGGNRHRGIDINGDIGSPVYAAAAGVVVWAGNSVYGYGNLIVLDHGGTFQTFYGHLDGVFVSCGQAVAAGDYIGTVGQTGLSTWPHLHFEVRYAGFNFNPRLYLP